jgi:hypothetical protein
MRARNLQLHCQSCRYASGLLYARNLYVQPAAFFGSLPINTTAAPDCYIASSLLLRLCRAR